MNNLLTLFGSSSGSGSADGATPTTIFEVYGENWDDGTETMSGHIGGPMSTIGTRFSTGAGLGRDTMNNISSGAYMTIDNQLNTDVDNYVVFYVGQYPSGVGTGLHLDFRGASSYNLITETRNGNGDTYNGYGYGTISNLGTWVDLTAGGEDNDVYKIRMWVFQGLKGNYYINGGTSAYNDDWLPTHLGGVGYVQNFHKITQSSQNCSVAHTSIHKFGASDTVSLTWVNAYANALVTYYTGLTWTDITAWT